jgi:hypothetical protein
MWFQEAEGAKFWLQVLNELKQRGVQDVLIACVEGLKGFPEAIEATVQVAFGASAIMCSSPVRSTRCRSPSASARTSVTAAWTVKTLCSNGRRVAGRTAGGCRVEEVDGRDAPRSQRGLVLERLHRPPLNAAAGASARFRLYGGRAHQRPGAAAPTPVRPVVVDDRAGVACDPPEQRTEEFVRNAGRRPGPGDKSDGVDRWRPVADVASY